MITPTSAQVEAAAGAWCIETDHTEAYWENAPAFLRYAIMEAMLPVVTAALNGDPDMVMVPADLLRKCIEDAEGRDERRAYLQSLRDVLPEKED